MSEANRKVNLTQSVLKALDILECLARVDRPLSAQEVAQRCGLSRPTAYRLLTTLSTRDFVTIYENSGRYQIGPRVLSLSESFLDRFDLPKIVRPNLQELSQQSRETVHLGVLSGTEILYVDKVDGPQSVRMHSTIGASNPLHSTAMGKAILAFLPREERDALLDEITLTPRTSNTIIARVGLIEHLEQVRAQRFAIDDIENEEGIRCVGAPIFDHRARPIAGISISGPAYRLSSSRIREFAELVKAATEAVSAKLGYESINL